MLLLGATGFAGPHFRAAAEQAGFEVVGAARRPGAAELTCELTDPGSVERAVVEAAPGAVVNLAGESGVARSWEDPRASFAANALGALNLVEAVAAHAPGAQLLLVSSGEAYGNPGEAELPLTEDREPAPVTPYGISKVAMELACGARARLAGLRLCVVRAFNHLGPGQDPAFAASSFARQIADAEREGAGSVTIRAGNLSPARDFSDVRDIVRAYLAVLEHGLAGTYNACSGRPVKIEKLIEGLREATELEVRVTEDRELRRPVDAPVLYGSAERLREATGWQPELALRQTLADLLADWRQRLAAEAV